jgi:hypothetical protein
VAKLPDHTIDRSGGAVLVTFAHPLDPIAQSQAHKELAKQYPGASIATIGDRQVSVIPGATKRSSAKTSS